MKLILDNGKVLTFPKGKVELFAAENGEVQKLTFEKSSNKTLEPRFYSLEQLKVIENNKTVCESCEHLKTLHQVSVSCKKCGCAGLSLLTGKCPVNNF